jgi:branched-chain amino acid transport system substrate-binding protein
MFRRKSRRTTIVSTTLALALLASACGGDGDDDTAAPPGLDGEADADADDGEVEADDGEVEADDGEAEGGDDVVRLGILGQCEGPFGGFHEDTVAGVSLALANYAGAEVDPASSALDGWENAEVNGTPIELVGIGCGDDTPDTILQEVRQLVEQQDANVVIGPLSGDEGIAVAEYANANPDVTFLSGIAGSQEPTLEVQAENYFRFHGDGAIWNAGLGDILHNQEGWDTVAVIADDYSFGHTSAAGFIADFCAVGGDVTTRVFPPLGTTDYSSFVQQLPDPDEVDGYFWVVGGTGTQAALEAFVNAKGDLTGDQHAGNLFFNPDLAQALGTDIAGAYVGGFATPPGDFSTPEIDEYLTSADETWDQLNSGIAGGEATDPRNAAGFGFMYGYYSAGVALVRALEETGGDPAADALQPALGDLTVELPYGPVSLDENRSGIVDVVISQLVEQDGEIVQQSVALIPEVDQTFGGTFSTETPPPSRDFPPCEEADLPWVGNAIPVVDGEPQR